MEHAVIERENTTVVRIGSTGAIGGLIAAGRAAVEELDAALTVQLFGNVELLTSWRAAIRARAKRGRSSATSTTHSSATPENVTAPAVGSQTA